MTSDLTAFKLERILHSRPTECYQAVLGLLGAENPIPTILVLQKNPWNLDTDKPLENNKELSHLPKTIVENGKWKTMEYAFGTSVAVSFISPAAEEDIFKYTAQKMVVFQETAERYKNLSLPFFEESVKTNKPDITWIHRILNGEKEQDRVLFNDNDPQTGFVFVEGQNWNSDPENSSNFTQFSGLVITRAPNLYSIRSLSSCHIPMLKNIQKAILNTVELKYGLNSEQIRLFFHYHPTFYHLHIHVNGIDQDKGFQACRYHSLETVISNLELMNDYYQKVTITCELKEASVIVQRSLQNNEKESI